MQKESKAGAWVLSTALLGSCVLALSACGSGGSSKDKTKPVASALTGASGATGATSSGAKPTKGSSGASGATSSPARSTPSSTARKRHKSSNGSSGASPTASQPAAGTKQPSKKGTTKRKQKVSGPSSFYTGQQKELYREAKVICAALTLNGLAHEYGVKRTPDAVARAYSHTYDVTLRGAVYEGCKSAFVK